MRAFDILLVTLGVALIVFVEFDIMATVLHPERESPLSTRFQRIIWRGLQMIGRLGRRRDGAPPILNWGLPLMIAGLIGLWLLLLTIGFALIYYPWITSETFFASPNPLERPSINALYYSGVTIATLGYGDIQPIAWPLQLVSVIEAMLGMFTASFSVAYVLAVYPALSRKRTLAVALDAEVAGHANGLPMVRRYITEQREWSDELADRLRELSMEIVAITEVHETHPVLYYAHPRRVQHSFLRILVTAQGLVSLLRYSLASDQHAAIVHNPQVLLLEQSLHYSLRRLRSSLHIPPLPESDEREERRHLAAAYAELCDDVQQIGLVPATASRARAVPVLVTSEAEDEDNAQHAPVQRSNGQTADPDDDIFDPALDLSSNSAVEAFVNFRRETDPYLAAYAAASGYPIEDARTNYETTWWGRGR